MKKINFKKIKKNIKGRINDFKVKRRKTKDKDTIVEKAQKKRNKNRFWYWFMIALITLAIIILLGGVAFCAYIVSSAPEFDEQQMFEKEVSRIFDSKGDLITTLGAEQREKLTYDEIPEVLIDAIIATEDSRFFKHNGFDAPRFLKASISQVLGRGGGGASTLTMQLSKLAFTDTVDTGIQGIIRKFTDIYMSVFKIEKNLTKEEIIEYYVNIPCLGSNNYGVEQASQYYFGKSAKDLNLVEAAMIAGLYQSPNGYNPYYNPNDGNARKNTVLYLMKRHGYITEDEYKAGTSVQIKDFLTTNESAGNAYQGFIDTVVQEVEDKTGNNPYNVPMDIYTTMVKSKQDVINNFYKTWKFKDDKIEVGIGVIDNNTGAIIAVGAGRDKSSAMTLNVATFHGQTKRMPGSTIKPILDYGPAIEYENLSTYGPFIDEKTKYGSGYMRNFNSSYKGFMTMRDCLKNSINTCALQAFRMTNNEQKKEFAANLGITFKEEVLPESYAIGAFNGVSPVQLAAAYSAFGNGGYHTSPYSYTKIVYRESGETINQDVNRKKVMKEQTAYIIANILTGATTSRVKVSGTQVATKTGTTSYDTNYLKKFGLTSSVIPDAWTSSFTTDYAIAIWYGYVDGLTSETVKNKYYLKNAHASSERLKIQAAICNNIYEKNSKFKNPGGITQAEVELETIPAASPSSYTPSKLKGTFMFISGTEPSEVSNRFSQLSNPTNLTATKGIGNITLSWTSPGVPDAVDNTYLTNYFTKGYTEWAENYLNKRLSYNKNNIGNFGFAIYLTKGSSTKYLGWTQDTTYNINLRDYIGYTGAIVKSTYSIFKTNASSGATVSFDGTSTGGDETPNTPDDSSSNSSDYDVKMSGLTSSLKHGSTYSELGISAIEYIKYNKENIKSKVNNLSVSITSAKKVNGESVSTNTITNEKGNYKVEYKVTFSYKGNNITKTFTQSVMVY